MAETSPENTPAPRSARRLVIGPALAFIAVLIAALNLRSGIVSVGAVLDDIIEAFDAPESLAGVVTAIPGIMFGIFGILAVPIARRAGLTGALFIGMLISLIGLVVRPWVGNIWSFIFFTGFVVIGIAVANVLLPAWVKSHGGRNVVKLMTVYTTSLGIGATLGPLTALVFVFDGGWRWAIFVWAAVGLVQMVIWAPIWMKTRYDFPPQPARNSANGSLWKSPTAVFIMLFFGIQSMNAYIQMGWLVKMFIDSGVSTRNASIGLSILGFMNVVGGILLPGIIARSRNLKVYPVAFGLCMFIGYIGVLLWPTQAWWLWSFILGVGAFCFPMAIALIPARTREPLVTARLSGFAQPVGYVLAAIGPFVVGWLYQLLGSWDAILIGLALFTLVLAAVGWFAARKSFVDDELQGAA